MSLRAAWCLQTQMTFTAFILKCTTRDDFKNQQSGMPGSVAPCWSHYQFVSIAIANRSAPCGLLPLGKVPMNGVATRVRASRRGASSGLRQERPRKKSVLSIRCQSGVGNDEFPKYVIETTWWTRRSWTWRTLLFSAGTAAIQGMGVPWVSDNATSPVRVLKVAGVTCMNKTRIFRVWNANAMSDNASITCLQIPADVAVILPDCDALYSYPTSY